MRVDVVETGGVVHSSVIPRSTVISNPIPRLRMEEDVKW
jgi:hypothetical protein